MLPRRSIHPCNAGHHSSSSPSSSSLTVTTTTLLFFTIIAIITTLMFTVTHASPSSSPQQGVNNHHGSAIKRPLLLIPGFGASILEAHHRTDKNIEPIRVFETFIDSQLKLEQYLLMQYCDGCLIPESVNPDYTVQSPIEKNFGLYAISQLNPDAMPYGNTTTRNYFYHMIQFLINDLGYVPGESLFAFPYDWRLNSTVHSPNLIAYVKKILELPAVKKNYGDGGQIDVISHSYGGIVFKQTLLQYPSEVRSLFHTYISIASPWKGTGMGFVGPLFAGSTMNNRAWSKDTVRVMQLMSPSVYEMVSLAYYYDLEQQEEKKEKKEKEDDNGQFITTSFTYEMPLGKKHVLNMQQTMELAEQALSNHSFVDYRGKKHNIPFGLDRVKQSEASSKRFMKHASKNGLSNVQPQYVYNIVGVMENTYLSRSVQDPVNSIYDIANVQKTELESTQNVNGDGVVPYYSAVDNGLETLVTTFKKAGHNAILNDESTFEDIRQFLGHSCPFFGTWKMTLVDVIANETFNIRVVGDVSFSHASELSMNGSIVSNRWTGQAHGPLGLATFRITQSKDCESFTGEWTYSWSTDVGQSQQLVGARVMGKECTKDMACHVENGSGTRSCFYGHYASTCMIDSCEKDHEMTIGQPYTRSRCISRSATSKNGVLFALLGILLGVIGLIVFIAVVYIVVTLVSRSLQTRKHKQFANSSYSQMLNA